MRSTPTDTPIRRHTPAWLSVLLTAAFLLCFSPAAQAFKISALEQLLMPGELIAGHAKVEDDCSQCHVDSNDETESRLCLSCHKDVAEDVKNKIGFHGLNASASKQECRNCHSDHLGRDADIVGLDKLALKHNQTDFKLTGKHIGVACGSCHQADQKYRDAPSACSDCHKVDDRHKGALGDECQTCHSTGGWREYKFDHEKTNFHLQGKHKDVACSACHADEQYKDVPTACVSCHILSDIHLGKNGKNCKQCHNQTDWKASKFKHNRDTNFRLDGRHERLACSQCHLANRYLDYPGKTCVSCHKSDDVHLGSIRQPCKTCHDSTSWKQVRFDHDEDTEFKLLGAHTLVPCITCHKHDRVDGPPAKQCFACHQTDDAHSGSLGQSCSQCHNQNKWQEKIRFNHELTRFPLVGGHMLIGCESCHATTTYKLPQSTCMDCHSSEDTHEGLWGENCATCHNPNDWKLWLFDHDAQTDFPLDGKHEGAACKSCHQAKPVPGTKMPSTCYSCHRKDDEHRLRFGKDCARCHQTTSFTDIKVKFP